MASDIEERWLLTAPSALAWRTWDDETVVFNQLTGNTHLLNDLGGEVLRQLAAADHGSRVDALVAAVSGSCEPVADVAPWRRAVAEVLFEFARLGLAHPDKS